MTVAHHELRVETRNKTETIDITARIADVVKEAGIDQGICVITVAHTTAGIFVNENADPDVQYDVLAILDRLVPEQGDYRHAEGNSPGHIKSILVGTAVTVVVRDAALALGRWQGVYFAEFDGPRRRHATVTILGDAAG
jgi:secondary thiamine-phosphate synthase enzyme